MSAENQKKAERLECQAEFMLRIIDIQQALKYGNPVLAKGLYKFVGLRMLDDLWEVAGLEPKGEHDRTDMTDEELTAVYAHLKSLNEQADQEVQS